MAEVPKEVKEVGVSRLKKINVLLRMKKSTPIGDCVIAI